MTPSNRLLLGCSFSLLVLLILGVLVFAGSPRYQTIILKGKPPSVPLLHKPYSLDTRECNPGNIQCLGELAQLRELQNETAKEALKVHRDLVLIEDFEQTKDHKIWVLWANYAASWILLVAVLGIVASGILMSYLQLKVDLKNKAPNPNSFKISKEGLEVNSPVIGLLVFIASAYFFTVYVDKIYLITLVKEKEAAKVDSTKSEKNLGGISAAASASSR